MTTRLVVIGAGGFGREVLDVVDALNAEAGTASEPAYEVLGFLDDGTPDAAVASAYDAKHLGGTSELESLPDDVGYVIGIGSPRPCAQVWMSMAFQIGRRVAHIDSPFRHYRAEGGYSGQDRLSVRMHRSRTTSGSVDTCTSISTARSVMTAVWTTM